MVHLLIVLPPAFILEDASESDSPTLYLGM